MTRLYLIRHGRPSGGWGEDDDDPGLNEAGEAQARATAAALLDLSVRERPTKVVSSPMRRCLETARPTAEALGVAIEIDGRVGEIPTPRSLAHEARPVWLRAALGGRWRDIDGDLDYETWRKTVFEAVTARPGTAIFSHFVAINAVLSVLTGDDRVVGFQPDHVSVMTLDVSDGQMSLLERGREAATRVL